MTRQCAAPGFSLVKRGKHEGLKYEVGRMYLAPVETVSLL